jgi:transcriptional regulator of heat shock response
VRGFVQSIDAARINNALQVVTDKLSLFAIGFVQVFEKISAEIEKFIVRMEYWSQFGVKMFSPDIRDAMMTELDKIDVDTKAKTARITETLQNATKTIKAFFDQQAAISSSAAAHGDAHDDHAAPKRDAAAMNLSAKLDADMQKEALEAQRAGLAEQLTQTKNFLNTQVSLERITAAQRIVAEAGAADKIYEHNVDLLNDELALYPKKSLEAAKINAEIEKLAQKHATEMKLLQGQEILALQQQYMQFLGTVQNAWDSQLQGLLSKTTSWAQAFKNILAQLAIEFIKWAEKKVLVYVAGEAAESAAAASGATTRLGVATAEAAGAAAVKKASVIDSIFQSGAQTFAGVFGFLSPIMGPAAAGPAAASEAVVDAQAGIASFAVGAWELPSDMIAQVHKGEMIVPAGPADALRSGGGGSPTYVTIHAMDARSVAAWAKDNAAALTGAVAGYQRNNPSSRGNF